MKPIGSLESCFREKFGTPRQSGLAKHARAVLTLTSDINPECLEGLEGFSHIYVIFVFHEGAEEYNKQKAKIAPPKLEGQKMGVFATRTPHRFNPIGLSIAKLDRVDLLNRCLHLSGIDLIDGTPVIDIKPYHYVDALPPDALKIPEWLEQTKNKDLYEVHFCDKATDDLKSLIDHDGLHFYKGADSLDKVLALITDVL
jgi:tRNA-Thr(GGU) m(6)t(6)A37 methyltransferase TsaA